MSYSWFNIPTNSKSRWYTKHFPTFSSLITFKYWKQKYSAPKNNLISNFQALTQGIIFHTIKKQYEVHSFFFPPNLTENAVIFTYSWKAFSFQASLPHSGSVASQLKHPHKEGATQPRPVCPKAFLCCFHISITGWLCSFQEKKPIRCLKMITWTARCSRSFQREGRQEAQGLSLGPQQTKHIGVLVLFQLQSQALTISHTHTHTKKKETEKDVDSLGLFWCRSGDRPPSAPGPETHW